MGYAPGDIGHLAKHDTIDTQLNAALNEQAGRLSAATLAAGFAAPRSKTSGGAAAPLVYINARDYGAAGDASTDDTAAINAALAACPAGGAVRLPLGRYLVTGTITVPTWVTLEGDSYASGAGSTSPTELKFSVSGSTVGITLGNLATLRNLTVRGPGTTTGTCVGITGATMFLDRVSIINWATGAYSTAGYYSTILNTEFSRNGIGLRLSACYNVNISATRFYCGSSVDDAPGIGISGAARGLNIFGGSIEGYASAVQMAASTHLGLYGVYFETHLDANAGGVWADGFSNISIVAIGCFVYLNGHTRWITTSGSTNTSVFARGNHFVAVTGSVQVPTAYILSSGQDVDIATDNWVEVAKVGAAYVSVSGGLPAPGLRVSNPVGGANSQVTYDGRRLPRLNVAQSLASNGAVTLDSSKGDQVVTLSANATSSTVTNAGPAREIMSISWVQDSTGGRTYVWPTVCRFAGGAAPSDTTLSTQTTVTFRYEAGTNRWLELSRSVAVPV